MPHVDVQEQLEGCVENIDQQFNTVLNRYENDFVNAYRVFFINYQLCQGHLVKVQKELVHLKKKANETAGKILNDDQITSLQKQISFFKNEAGKLDHILETQKRELQKFKSRELNINEDRKFLKDQTMEAMKQNKLLQVALKKTKQQNSLLKEFLDKNKVGKGQGNQSRGVVSPKMIINQTMNQFKEPFITQQEPVTMDNIGETSEVNVNNLMKFKAKHQKNIPKDLLSQESQDFMIKEFVQDLFKRGYSKDKIESKIIKFFKLYDLTRDDKIEDLQRKLENFKRTNTKIKNTKAFNFSEKSEVENLFLDCIDECKKDVIKRKTLINASKTQFANINQTNSSNIEAQQLIDQITMQKEVLIGVFEEMFGSGGFVGTAIGTLEHHIKNKKYSLVSQGPDNDFSYYTNATTKDNQSEEAERVHTIMNAPIENLINNMSNYSQSQTKIGFYNRYSQNASSMRIGKQRASTAIGGYKTSTQNQTALTYIDDSSTNKDQIINNIRAQTSHSQNRRIIINGKSRQQPMNQKSTSKERSFSVKNGKLVMNQTFYSSNNGGVKQL